MQQGTVPCVCVCMCLCGYVRTVIGKTPAAIGKVYGGCIHYSQKCRGEIV